MPISVELCDSHIARWETTLRKSAYPYRKNWPGRLFRHEPLENAVRVIRSGVLKSRTEAGDDIATDIAPEGIIHGNDAAHADVRLYFRPRTPTQWNIEGIREPSDFFQGKHAAVLYMFLFDARRVLTAPGVRFSDGNMQSPSSYVYEDDAGFESLQFDNIYHEGPISNDRRDTVRRARCAEVLCCSPLTLRGKLEAIICRSDAERQLLLHELGRGFSERNRIRVFKEPGMFNADFSFVESVDLSADGIRIRFHPPNRGVREARVQVTIKRIDGKVLRSWDTNLDVSKNWKLKKKIEDGRYKIEVKLRDCLAYRSEVTLDSVPF